MQLTAEPAESTEMGTSFPKEPKQLVSVKEAAQEFGIGRDRLYQLAHTVPSTGFPALWFGPRKLRIPREALKEWLNSEKGRLALYQTAKG